MRTLTSSLAVLAVVFSAPGLAAEDNDAQSLYEQNCVSCHGSEVFTREDHKIGSLPALDQQVQRCQAAQGLDWSENEVSGVAQLLNERYYHFTPGS